MPVVVKPITAQVKYAGCQVPKSPFKIPVEPGVGDASKVKLSGPAVEGPVKSQEPTYFVVDAKEAGPGWIFYYPIFTGFPQIRMIYLITAFLIYSILRPAGRRTYCR